MSKRRFCTFIVDGLFFGVPVEKVQEAIRHEQIITPIPLAHPAIEGLMNLRGRIVTAIDLRHRLGLQTRHDTHPMHIIIQSEDSLISLLVDELNDVMEIDDAIFEQPPESLTGATRELVKGAYKLESQLLFILNVDEAITVSGHATVTH